MNRKQYRKIAKIHGVSVAEVKRDMQAAIDVAYEKPNLQAQSVEYKGEKPTVDEFIAYATKKAKSKIEGE